MLENLRIAFTSAYETLLEIFLMSLTFAGPTDFSASRLREEPQQSSRWIMKIEEISLGIKGIKSRTSICLDD